MKTALICFLMSFMNHGCLVAQSCIKCKPGFTYFPEIGTTSLHIKGGCVPDSVAKKLWILFRRNTCEETSYGWIGDNMSYFRNNVWVNDSIGCISKEIYHKKTLDGWVEISKNEYDSLKTLTK